MHPLLRLVLTLVNLKKKKKKEQLLSLSTPGSPALPPLQTAQRSGSPGPAQGGSRRWGSGPEPQRGWWRAPRAPSPSLPSRLGDTETSGPANGLLCTAPPEQGAAPSARRARTPGALAPRPRRWARVKGHNNCTRRIHYY